MGFEPKIIFEDQDVLVIDKPTGLSVHSDGFKKEITLADWLVGRFPELIDVGEMSIGRGGQEISRPGIVHRLDRDTSGVMIIAKNQPAFNFLKKQFKDRLVKKTYQAIVVGVFAHPEEEKTIDLPIGRSAKDSRKRVASKKAEGILREAKTIFKVLESFGKDYSLVEAYPQTGRTHQIRVHFKAVQHPIACDGLYSNKSTCISGLLRQALHAYKLDIKLPSGDRREFIVDLPADMVLALDHLRRS